MANHTVPSRTNRSRQRETILQVLRSTKTHPTADWIYRRAKEALPNLSLGTVYRNLTKLAGAGEIKKLDIGDGFDHFDADVQPHYHMVCTHCGRVQDLDLPYHPELNSEAEKAARGSISHHALYFYGTCASCEKAAQDTADRLSRS